MKTVKVFISYSTSQETHKAWVRQFAGDLAAHQLAVRLDQFEVGFGDDFVDFMAGEIAESNFFLFISTDESRRIADRETSNSEQRGLWFELRAARQRADAQGADFKEICILLEGPPPKHFESKRYLDCREQSLYASRIHELAMELKFGRKKPQPAPPETAWRVGGITIPDIVPELVFVGDNALAADQLRSSYEDRETDIPAQLHRKRAECIAKMRQEARGRFTFDNNSAYDLRGIDVERPQTANGGRRNIYTLHIRPSQYYHFAYPNLVLDNPATGDDEQTAREVIGLHRGQLRFDSLADFACAFHIGTGTVFITADNQIMVSVRSRRQFIVGGATYHLSAAEGALRPADEVEGQFSPFHTSVRSLEDELGLTVEVDYRVSDLRCLGLLLDTLRAQPICLFFVKSESVTAAQALNLWQTKSIDKHENNHLVFMNWDKNTARILLAGQLDVDGSLHEIASNHAQAGFALATLHSFGEAALAREPSPLAENP